MKIISDPRCTEYSAPGHPERPARVRNTLELLKIQTRLPLTWATPLPADDEALLRAHSPQHLESIKSCWDFDADTPAYPDIDNHARRSVGGALQALQCAQAGEKAFSLLRPPGHHATRERAMGFCYYNSVAAATLAARAAGAKKVVVFDFDVHHGNGTEDILLDQKNCAFISVHQHPCYPGTGTADRGANCFNFPVAPATPRADYRAMLARAFEKLRALQPDMIAVSAGFDAFSGDPLADGSLEAEDFHWLGELIRQTGVPAFSVLEGGYSDTLPELILAYLTGWNG